MRKLFMLLCALAFFGSSLPLAAERWDREAGEKMYSLLRKEAGMEFLEERQNKKKEGERKPIFLPEPDTSGLSLLNQDYAGWLCLPGTGINYPVVAPESDQSYLRVGFDGEKRSCGTLFFDTAAEPLKSLNTVIHGHNMRSGEMFGGLKQYLDPEFAKAHRELLLHDRERWRRYRLTAVYRAENSDFSPYQNLFSDEKEFRSFAASRCEKSSIPLEKNEAASEFLTLSTCHGKSEKLILHWQLYCTMPEKAVY